MPDVDGLEATRLIRAHGRFAALPIVAMTANATRADREACLAAGMNDHVGKPIDVKHLVNVLLAQTRAIASPVAMEALAADEAAASELLERKESIVRRFGGSEDLIRRTRQSTREFAARFRFPSSARPALGECGGGLDVCTVTAHTWMDFALYLFGPLLAFAVLASDLFWFICLWNRVNHLMPSRAASSAASRRSRASAPCGRPTRAAPCPPCAA
ncbi:response regulator [Paraburkholderia phymatum]|uniref:response regulator n=1 Tax=Paraburkholderia phymatum TaxID=148447 RepID=UPI000A0259D4|nr:response regulator [Paraburkholderia phymatum]